MFQWLFSGVKSLSHPLLWAPVYLGFLGQNEILMKWRAFVECFTLSCFYATANVEGHQVPLMLHSTLSDIWVVLQNVLKHVTPVHNMQKNILCLCKLFKCWIFFLYVCMYDWHTHVWNSMAYYRNFSFFIVKSSIFDLIFNSFCVNKLHCAK